jgi:hypothetical protein
MYNVVKFLKKTHNSLSKNNELPKRSNEKKLKQIRLPKKHFFHKLLGWTDEKPFFFFADETLIEFPGFQIKNNRRRY